LKQLELKVMYITLKEYNRPCVSHRN
jgi:hypothetical protein